MNLCNEQEFQSLNGNYIILKKPSNSKINKQSLMTLEYNNKRLKINKEEGNLAEDINILYKKLKSGIKIEQLSKSYISQNNSYFEDTSLNCVLKNNKNSNLEVKSLNTNNFISKIDLANLKENNLETLNDKVIYTCSLCDYSYNRLSCVIFSCRHVFCGKCCKLYFEDRIENYFLNVNCPLVKCLECQDISILKDIISEIHFNLLSKHSEISKDNTLTKNTISDLAENHKLKIVDQKTFFELCNKNIKNCKLCGKSSLFKSIRPRSFKCLNCLEYLCFYCFAPLNSAHFVKTNVSSCKIYFKKIKQQKDKEILLKSCFKTFFFSLFFITFSYFIFMNFIYVSSAKYFIIEIHYKRNKLFLLLNLCFCILLKTLLIIICICVGLLILPYYPCIYTISEKYINNIY